MENLLSRPAEPKRYLTKLTVSRKIRQLLHSLQAFMRLELVVVLMMACVLTLCYTAVQQVRNPKGPHGQIYPTTPPSEDRRITHPTGLSIVVPINWDQILDEGPLVPFLCVSSRGYPGARLRSWIEIRACEEPPIHELSKLSKTRFQTHDAFESMEIQPSNADSGLSMYTLFVNAPDQWWCVRYCIADKTTTLSPRIKAYIDTIKLPIDQITTR